MLCLQSAATHQYSNASHDAPRRGRAARGNDDDRHRLGRARRRARDARDARGLPAAHVHLRRDARGLRRRCCGCAARPGHAPHVGEPPRRERRVGQRRRRARRRRGRRPGRLLPLRAALPLLGPPGLGGAVLRPDRGRRRARRAPARVAAAAVREAAAAAAQTEEAGRPRRRLDDGGRGAVRPRVLFGALDAASPLFRLDGVKLGSQHERGRLDAIDASPRRRRAPRRRCAERERGHHERRAPVHLREPPRHQADAGTSEI